MMPAVTNPADIVLGPPAKPQPKRLSGCIECTRAYEPFDSAKHPMAAMHRDGWRIREVNGRLVNVCPAHTQEDDW